MQESFDDWLEGKYGDLQLTPRHTEIALLVYEEEKLKNDRMCIERDDPA
jgi:hypothetical protein